MAMANTTRKATKSEIVSSIYNLKFYKKKDNWKLSQNKPLPENVPILNETYNVDSWESILNGDSMAGPCTAADTEIIPQPEDELPLNNAFIHDNSSEELVGEDMSCEAMCLNDPANTESKIISGAHAQSALHDYSGGRAGGGGCKRSVLALMPYTLTTENEPTHVAACAPMMMESHGLLGNWVVAQHHHHLPHEHTTIHTQYTEVLRMTHGVCEGEGAWLESERMEYEQFALGASAAPHSSELELHAPPLLHPPAASAPAMSWGSSMEAETRPLAPAGMQHSQTTHIQNIYHPCMADMNHKYDELPTRDVGLYSSEHTDCIPMSHGHTYSAGRGAVLAGPDRVDDLWGNIEVAGRGRGRLRVPTDGIRIGRF